MYKDNHILVNFSRSFPRIEEGERDKFPKRNAFLLFIRGVPHGGGFN